MYFCRLSFYLNTNIDYCETMKYVAQFECMGIHKSLSKNKIKFGQLLQFY